MKYALIVFASLSSLAKQARKFLKHYPTQQNCVSGDNSGINGEECFYHELPREKQKQN